MSSLSSRRLVLLMIRPPTRFTRSGALFPYTTLFRSRRVWERPQKEVAARGGISQKTVEKQVAKAVRLRAGHFYGNGQAPGPARTREPEIEDEDGHGRQHPDLAHRRSLAGPA